MSGVRGPAVLYFVVAMIAPGVSAQDRPLNPTVRVLPKPQSMIPTNCDDGLAPAAPRPVIVATEETPSRESESAPPSADLRTRLRRVQTAAERGDHEAFKAALRETRSATAAYPAGGEKQAATEALQVYADIERLWGFSQRSPTGSFFDAGSDDGAVLGALRKYPEFPRVVAGATMTIGGQAVYPSRETREFLVNEAAKRLTRLGVRTPGRVVQETPRTQPASRGASVAAGPATPPAPRTTTRTTTPPARREPRTTTPPTSRGSGVMGRSAQTPRSTSKPTPKVATKAASTTRVPAPVRREPVVASRPIPNPVPAPVPQPQPVQRPTQIAQAAPRPLPSPVPNPVPAPVTTTTEPPTPTATSMPMTETAAPTETTATNDATATTATAETTPSQPANAAPARAGGMNMIFAVILIVVGIGVLVVLFRSSD